MEFKSTPSQPGNNLTIFSYKVNSLKKDQKKLITTAWTFLSRFENNFLSGYSALTKLIILSNFTLTISPKVYQHSNQSLIFQKGLQLGIRSGRFLHFFEYLK